MKSSRLPISLCHENCIKCGLPMEFGMFESGPGGDFSTYIGLSTQDFYRVDLGQIQYLGKSLGQLLAPAIEREGGAGNLLHIPEQIRCKHCGTVFSAERYMIDSEKVVDAYEL